MQQSDNTFIKHDRHENRLVSIVFIPKEPVIAFGSVEVGEKVYPQRFTVEVATDTQGTITTDADWFEVEPITFAKGQTDITVRLLSEKLQRGQQLHGKVTASITTPVNEQRHIPVSVKVRQYSERETEAMAEQLEETQKQLNKLQQQVKLTSIIDGLFERRYDYSAIKDLAQLGEQAVEPLISLLGEVEWDVRFTASEALVQIGEPAVEPLINALKDEDEDVRSWAAYALGELGDKRAVEPLIDALKDKDEFGARMHAIEALGKLGDKRAVEPFVNMLNTEDKYAYDDEEVRMAIGEALKKIRGE
jgi:hypothetical protein